MLSKIALKKISVFVRFFHNFFITFVTELEWWCPVMPWLRLYTLHQYR